MDDRLLQRLRAGDHAAFGSLVATMSPGLLRVARSYVSSETVAEEVVQETWIGVLKGIHAFEGRASLRTWVFRILRNQAVSRATSEMRSVPFAELATGTGDVGPGVSQWSHADLSPAEAAENAELLAAVRSSIDRLPARQRLTITMRDLEGWSAGEVCEALGISSANQRVLLHRARSRVRSALSEPAA